MLSRSPHLWGPSFVPHTLDYELRRHCGRLEEGSPGPAGVSHVLSEDGSLVDGGGVVEGARAVV